jgi:hypothetical protein
MRTKSLRDKKSFRDHRPMTPSARRRPRAPTFHPCLLLYFVAARTAKKAISAFEK